MAGGVQVSGFLRMTRSKLAQIQINKLGPFIKKLANFLITNNLINALDSGKIPSSWHLLTTFPNFYSLFSFQKFKIISVSSFP
jgi:hypothetical protein